MSQTVTKGVPHKILVKNRNPGTISTGMNTEVLLDGQRIKYCTFFKMEVKPKGVAKITIEFLADVEFEGEAELIKYTNRPPNKLSLDGLLVSSDTDSDSDIVDNVSNSGD